MRTNDDWPEDLKDRAKRMNDDNLRILVGYLFGATIPLGALLVFYLLTHPPKTEVSAPACQCECRTKEGEE